MPYKIEYEIKGNISVPDDVYEEIGGWEDMNYTDRLEAIKDFEDDCGNKSIYDDVVNAKLTVTSVTKV